MSRSDDIKDEKAARARNKRKVLFCVIGVFIGFLAYNIAKAFGLV